MGAAEGIYNIASFGARGDGVMDDTAAIQRAIDAASAKGGVVEVRVGFALDRLRETWAFSHKAESDFPGIADSGPIG
jgi:hypothetical protein